MVCLRFFPSQTDLDAEVLRMRRAHGSRLQLFTPQSLLLPETSPRAHLEWAARFLKPRQCRHQAYFQFLQEDSQACQFVRDLHNIDTSAQRPLVQLLLAPVRTGHVSLLLQPAESLQKAHTDIWQKARLLLSPFLKTTFLFENEGRKPLYPDL